MKEKLKFERKEFFSQMSQNHFCNTEGTLGVGHSTLNEN